MPAMLYESQTGVGRSSQAVGAGHARDTKLQARKVAVKTGLCTDTMGVLLGYPPLIAQSEECVSVGAWVFFRGI